MFFFFFSIQN